MKYSGLVIGIPKEILPGERRVSATPATVSVLVQQGATVLVETGAGAGAFFSDEAYAEAGAKLMGDVREIFAQADLILKVKEPQYNAEYEVHEADLLREGQTLITFLHPASPSNHDLVRKLAERGVTSLTLDSIPRISRAQTMDALTSMSTVAGYKAVLMAANRLPKFLPLLGTAVGMIQPAQVLVIGAGVAGLQALATAKRLGAVVFAADIRPDAQEQAKSLGARLVDLGIPAELAIGEGGYAQALSEEWLDKEREVLLPAISQADIVILSALVPGREAPVLLTEEMVKAMRPGSQIVDISIDQGGNCALSEAGRVVEKYGVTIDGTKNIPGTMPASSTDLFSKNVLNLVNHLVQAGKLVLDLEDEITRETLVTRGGEIVHKGTLESMRLRGEGQ
ncbi:MAG: Re/Si-specific NAD(P)(+) transhydrogenase subunit alpha [Firmicutes bacterium]|jgi:NAD(P) transhydrogenase subunit alpha|nr:Re/Si-specific NAD(P)(+) transhydrogenase subunit alpha [Bacillota bacterium]NLO66549.1 Re/Si-specific NAD(P)(+) transhydrogenase subunit alpha [Bacillota bacterium]